MRSIVVHCSLFPNSGSFRVLVVIQRTGEEKEFPFFYSRYRAGRLAAEPPEDEKCDMTNVSHFALMNPQNLQKFA